MYIKLTIFLILIQCVFGFWTNSLKSNPPPLPKQLWAKSSFVLGPWVFLKFHTSSHNMKRWSLIPFWWATWNTKLWISWFPGFFQCQGTIFPPRVGLVILPVRCCSNRSWSRVQQQQQMLFTIFWRGLRSKTCEIKKTCCVPDTHGIIPYIAGPISNDFWFTDGPPVTLTSTAWTPRFLHLRCDKEVLQATNFIWIYKHLNTQTMICSWAFIEVNLRNRVSDTYWVDIRALGARSDHNRQARVPKGWAEAHGWDCPNTQDSCLQKQLTNVQDQCKMNLFVKAVVYNLCYQKLLELSQSSRLAVLGKLDKAANSLSAELMSLSINCPT